MKRENETLIELTVEIGGYNRTHENEIKRVCMVEWSFRKEDFFQKPSGDGKHKLLEASALGTLYGGETVDDIIQRIERAVWRANTAMCHVEVHAVKLNNPPEWNAAAEEREYELQIA